MPHNKSRGIVALQMDPLESINPQSDSTVALALEAMNRGYTLFAYMPDALSYQEGEIVARGHWVTFKDQPHDFYTLGDETLLNLKEARFILMRQNPPFDMAYIAATHLLELLPPTTRVINDPRGVRNSPEKLLVNLFPHLTPPTLISWDRSLIDDFISAHGAVIIKPIFEFGGNGVRDLRPGDSNLEELLELYHNDYKTPPIFQKFLPEVTEGDKRIVLIDGKPVGIFNRVPPQGQILSNMRQGGVSQPCEYADRDLEICAEIGPTLKEQGLYFVGIDVIGGYLTEINVTSPTGVRTIKDLYGVDVSKTFWDGLA